MGSSGQQDAVRSNKNITVEGESAAKVPSDMSSCSQPALAQCVTTQDEQHTNFSMPLRGVQHRAVASTHRWT